MYVGVWNKARNNKKSMVMFVYLRVGVKLEGANTCEDHQWRDMKVQMCLIIMLHIQES